MWKEAVMAWFKVLILNLADGIGNIAKTTVGTGSLQAGF